MTNRFELYKCNICGNLIEILLSGDGHPVCCGKEMERIEAKNDTTNAPALTEKHTPFTEHQDLSSGTTVTVRNHPMEDEHYIMFIQAISKDKKESKIKFFSPSDTVSMKTDIDYNGMDTRSYCNIHGLYVNNNNLERI